METRYRIRARLKCVTPLHLGSGEITTRRALVNERTGERVEIAAVAQAAVGGAYLPGSSLKGVLRAQSVALGLDQQLVEKIFGGENRGGSLRVYDALRARSPGADGEAPTGPEVEPAYWDAERWTGVAPRVALDRRRGVAGHNLLVHEELVPEGTVFDLEVLALGREAEEAAGALVGLLSEGAEIALGARTADDWGRCAIGRLSVARLGESELRAWVDEGAGKMLEEAFVDLDPAAIETLARGCGDEDSLPAGGTTLDLDLVLRFDGPFLVKDYDPKRAGRGQDRPDAVPRRDGRGRIILPASSLRGALRSQGERILRTLGGPGAACGPGAPRPPCNPVERPEAIAELCPACRIFGAPGWRSPVRVTSCATAKAIPDADLFRQDFVAIDRFTGGGEDAKKFNCLAALDPELRGSLRLELVRGQGDEVWKLPSWGLVLFLLALRDLAEGDVSLGGNGARGYGAATIEVTLKSPEMLPATLDSLLPDASGLEGESWRGLVTWPWKAETPLGVALAGWLDELGEIAAATHATWEAREPGDAEPVTALADRSDEEVSR